MDELLVSVILPAHNSEKYIQDAISSVLLQSYSNLELIIVDDCSKDLTHEIALSQRRIDKRIKVFKTEKNSGGPALPRNIGIECSRGKYIAFIDSDDVWIESKLAQQMQEFDKTQSNFTSSNCLPIDSEGIELPTSFIDNIIVRIMPKNGLRSLLIKNFIINSSVIVEKKAFGKNRFDVDPLMVAMEDWHLWLELFSKNGIRYSYMQQKLVKYRVRRDSIVRREDRKLNKIRRSYCLAKLRRKYPANTMLNMVEVIEAVKGVRSLLSI